MRCNLRLKNIIGGSLYCLLLGFGVASYAQVAPPTAVDDNFDTNLLSPFPDPQGFVIDPLANDNVQQLDTQAFYNTQNFVPQQQGGGIIQPAFDPQNNQVLVYSPPPSFNGTAVFTYTITNGGGSDTATITIVHGQQQPPPTTSNDNYVGDNLTTVPSQVPGELGYVLGPIPFANDVLNAPYDEAGTINASGNFALVSGTGSLQVTLGQSGPVFVYFPGSTFTTDAVFSYFLADAMGIPINNTNATITITAITPPPPPIDAVDDVFSADQLQTVVDPVTGNVGYQFTPLANDVFLNNDLANIDLNQTLNPSNFVRVQGIGSLSATFTGGSVVFTYVPGGQFNAAAVFDYTLFDNSGNTDNAQITINPPGTLPPVPALTGKSDIEDVCAEELVNQRIPAICNDALISANERQLILSTITAQADSILGMQSDLISNIRQRMGENRNVYNPASVAGLNSNLYGEQVPLGRIVQELLKPLTGGAAADDLFDSGRLGFFLNGNFSAGDRKGSGLIGGYDQEGYNFSTGFDYRINLNFIMGAALGIANEKAEFAANRGEQDVDLTSIAIYGNYFPPNSFYGDFLLMLSQGDLDVDRNVIVGPLNEVARAGTDGELWSFAGTLGYHWNRGAWEIDGYTRLEFSELEIDGYAEFGSSFDLTVDAQDVESLEAALGLKVAKVFSLDSGVVIPAFDIEWLSQFEDDTRFIGVNMEQISSGFAVQDQGADSSYFNAALSFSSVFANGFSAFLRVDSQLGDDNFSRTTYGGGLRWEF